MRGRAVSWGSVALLVLLAVASGIGASVAGSPSPKSQLQAALNATFGASGYETTTNLAPDTLDIVNAPNVSEVIQNGRISQIVVGRTFYWSGWYFKRLFTLASGCNFGDTFVRLRPNGGAYVSIAYFSPQNLKREEVVHSGDRFTVLKNGTEVVSYIVREGYVVESVIAPRQLRGNIGVPTQITTFTHVGSAPRITVPRRSEVMVFPPIVGNSCPLGCSRSMGQPQPANANVAECGTSGGAFFAP